MARGTWAALTALLLCLAMSTAQAQDPKMRDIGKKPPRGAIVLFDGKSGAAWKHRGTNAEFSWRIVDGAMEVTPGYPDIVTKQEFGDYELHVEFCLPFMPNAKGQERANSGVYNHGRYEIQVLDMVDNETYKAGGCGAIYGLKDPDQLVPRKPGEWQSYDILFRAPRFGPDGKVVENPRLTVFWNGVKIHDRVEIPPTNTVAGISGDPPARGPILLQNHGNPVRFRNIWIRELKDALPAKR